MSSDSMQAMSGIEVLFLAGFGPVVRDDSSRELYQRTLGIEFEGEKIKYLHTDSLKGAGTFALWPLDQAAQSCFGTDVWPDEIPVPQAWLEFEVGSVEAATAELESRGYKILVANKVEPWGQTVSRFMSPEGLLAAVTYTPWHRKEKQPG